MWKKWTDECHTKFRTESWKWNCTLAPQLYRNNGIFSGKGVYEISVALQNQINNLIYFHVVKQKLLVDAFSSFFRNDKNPHIKLFYLIVPTLIINYIEYIVAAKENMTKKSKQLGTCFTDDGFAMGLAYVLRVLDQNTEFNSLHWFKVVRQKFSAELEQLTKAHEENTGNSNASTSNYDAKLQQTLALSEKRITVIQHEFDLLYCSLNSAKIFFQWCNIFFRKKKNKQKSLRAILFDFIVCTLFVWFKRQFIFQI